MYSSGQVLVPTTGFGPAMGFAILTGYPVAAAALGVACAGCIAFLLIRKKRLSTE